MFKPYFFFSILISAIFLYGCSKKVYPVNPESNAAINNKVDSTNTAKKVIKKRKVKEPVPKTISVNDAIAKKTVDGRLYYDLDGHRYWRNNKDGKYYLFNKAMYDQAEFKPN